MSRLLARLPHQLSHCRTRHRLPIFRPTFISTARVHHNSHQETTELHEKYAEKLKKRAETSVFSVPCFLFVSLITFSLISQGVTVEELVEQIREKEKKERDLRRKKDARKAIDGDRAFASHPTPSEAQNTGFHRPPKSKPRHSPFPAERKDNSPVKVSITYHIYLPCVHSFIHLTITS